VRSSLKNAVLTGIYSRATMQKMAGVYGNRTHRERLSHPPLVLKTRPGTSRGNTPESSIADSRLSIADCRTPMNLSFQQDVNSPVNAIRGFSIFNWQSRICIVFAPIV
jgi:hypothetical protein